MDNDTAIITLLIELQNDRQSLRAEVQRLRGEVERLQGDNQALLEQAASSDPGEGS